MEGGFDLAIHAAGLLHEADLQPEKALADCISDNRLGGWYGYRASKAALNQFMRTLLGR